MTPEKNDVATDTFLNESNNGDTSFSINFVFVSLFFYSY